MTNAHAPPLTNELLAKVATIFIRASAAPQQRYQWPQVKMTENSPKHRLARLEAFAIFTLFYDS